MKTIKADAQTILNQLGGNRFLAMTGASQLVDMGDGLKMKLPRNASKCNQFMIQLLEDDTYRVTFATYRKLEFKVKKQFDGIYFDQLQEIFTRETGMYTSL